MSAESFHEARKATFGVAFVACNRIVAKTCDSSSMEINPAEIAYVPTIGVRKIHQAPLVLATEDSLKGYGHVVHDPKAFTIEITRWPAQRWRPIDENSGDQGGVTRESSNRGGMARRSTRAAARSATATYLAGAIGRKTPPRNAPTTKRERALIWRANYHPDGGQLFYPTKGQLPLALPGDDVTPEKLTTFLCHGPIIPLGDRTEPIDRQGRVHARVSVDFPQEFGCYLVAPLPPGG